MYVQMHVCMCTYVHTNACVQCTRAKSKLAAQTDLSLPVVQTIKTIVHKNTW